MELEGKFEKILVNKTEGRFTINFLGVFPNKWANPGGKIYLTDKEWDFVQVNLKHILEKGYLVEEGSEKANEPVKTKDDKEEEYKKFFSQHVNKLKSQIAKMEDLNEINTLIDYADDNEINNKAVNALIERANELGGKQ